MTEMDRRGRSLNLKEDRVKTGDGEKGETRCARRSRGVTYQVRGTTPSDRKSIRAAGEICRSERARRMERWRR